MAAFARLMAEAKHLAQTDMEKLRVGQFERGIWLPMVEGAARKGGVGRGR